MHCILLLAMVNQMLIKLPPQWQSRSLTTSLPRVMEKAARSREKSELYPRFAVPLATAFKTFSNTSAPTLAHPASNSTCSKNVLRDIFNQKLKNMSFSSVAAVFLHHGKDRIAFRFLSIAVVDGKTGAKAAFFESFPNFVPVASHLSLPCCLRKPVEKTLQT